MAENDPKPEEAQAPAAANTALVEAAKEAIELQKPIEVSISKAPAPLEATAALTEAEDEDDIFVAARTVQEMNIAQAKLIGWANGKMAKMKAEIEAAEKNLDKAKKSKWATEPFKKIVAVATRKCEFYEKAKAALEAGYTIIPDMPMDVFAVRTTKKNPRRNDASSSIQYGGGPWIRDQETNNPALGEGKFVRPKAIEETRQWEAKNKDGTPNRMEKKWATEFMEDIDFPFKFARPVVLDAAAQALSEKIFDQIGVAPSTNGGSTTRHRRAKGDPMVIGRIYYRQGYHEKGISFLVTWFIDSKDL